MKRSVPSLAVLIVTMTLAASALGASQRTFVASYGNDANAAAGCSRTLPCRSFAAAIGQVVAGGEVIALDSAGYGPVSIGKSVSITAPGGIYAGISVLTTSGIGVIVSGSAIDVTLRGLTINALVPNAAYGVFFATGARLAIDRCAFVGFSSAGVAIVAPGSVTNITDTTIRRSDAGVLVSPSTGSVSAMLDRTRIDNTGDGVQVRGNSTIDIRDSMISGSALSGVRMEANGGVTTQTTLDRVWIHDSTFQGVDIVGQPGANTATVAMTRSVVSGSQVGLRGSATSATAILTAFDSTIAHQTTAGMYLQVGAIGHVGGNTVVLNDIGYAEAGGTLNTLKTSYVRGNTMDVQGVPTLRPGQ